MAGKAVKTGPDGIDRYGEADGQGARVLRRYRLEIGRVSLTKSVSQARAGIQLLADRTDGDRINDTGFAALAGNRAESMKWAAAILAGSDLFAPRSTGALIIDAVLALRADGGSTRGVRRFHVCPTQAAKEPRRVRRGFFGIEVVAAAWQEAMPPISVVTSNEEIAITIPQNIGEKSVYAAVLALLTIFLVYVVPQYSHVYLDVSAQTGSMNVAATLEVAK